MPSMRWNSEPGKQSPCKRRRGVGSFPTFPRLSSRGLDSKVFALAGYILLAGPIDMPQEIVERPFGPDGGGRQDRQDTEAARQVWHRRVRSRAHRVQEAVRRRNAHLGGCREGIGACA